MLLDGNLLISTEHSVVAGALATATATVELQAGSVHSVRIEFVNDSPQVTDAGPQFKFSWIPPAGVVAPQAIAAAALARNAQAAIVLVRDYGGEGADKQTLHLPNGQGDLIRQVTAANPRTIVVLTTAGAMQTSDWDSAVPAVLEAWYGGQEQGNAIARILFGDVDPSGKLPITIPVDDAHTPVSTPEQFPGVNLDSNFSEGIFVGYRGYEQFGLKPSYAFGYGLSYTTFKYSDLEVSASGPQISLNVQNTGRIAGMETVEAYVGNLPTTLPTAPKALAGWRKINLQPGETKNVIIDLDRQSLSYWDVNQHQWVMPSGAVPIMVGASSADIRLTGELHVGEPAPTMQTQAQR
jgi:beta-glucosidase